VSGSLVPAAAALVVGFVLGGVPTWLLWRRRLDAREARIRSLQVSLKAKEVNLLNLRARLQQSEATVECLRVRIGRGEEAVRDLTDRLEERNQFIGHLRSVMGRRDISWVRRDVGTDE
jgi:chromosome segregation ATPase